MSPITVSVDLDAAAKARNEYSYNDVTIENNRIEAKGSDDKYFSYEHLGKLKNGIHVLKTYDYGGTAVFENLFFVKFSTDEAYDENGKIYSRLLMTVVRDFILGDRDNGKIEIKGDRVIISRSRYRDEEVVLSF